LASAQPKITIMRSPPFNAGVPATYSSSCTIYSLVPVLSVARYTRFKQLRGIVVKKRFLIPLIMVVLAAGCGPIGPMPGLNIGGEQQPAPDDFAFVQDHDLLMIRTLFGGWLPQVHYIWGVGVEDAIYAVPVPGASWRARLDDDPNVLMRVGEGYYELTATPVADTATTQAAFDAYVSKYGSQLEGVTGHPPTLEDMNGLLRFTAR
jgi:hypothetical protein